MDSRLGAPQTRRTEHAVAGSGYRWNNAPARRLGTPDSGRHISLVSNDQTVARCEWPPAERDDERRANVTIEANKQVLAEFDALLGADDLTPLGSSLSSTERQPEGFRPAARPAGTSRNAAARRD
jgi:hypothetical protein